MNNDKALNSGDAAAAADDATSINCVSRLASLELIFGPKRAVWFVPMKTIEVRV